MESLQKIQSRLFTFFQGFLLPKISTISQGRPHNPTTLPNWSSFKGPLKYMPVQHVFCMRFWLGMKHMLFFFLEMLSNRCMNALQENLGNASISPVCLGTNTSIMKDSLSFSIVHVLLKCSRTFWPILNDNFKHVFAGDCSVWWHGS